MFFLSDGIDCHELHGSPALVVPLVSCWDCQTLVHVTVEQSEHIPTNQKT